MRSTKVSMRTKRSKRNAENRVGAEVALNIPRPIGFPDRIRTRLRYMDTVSPGTGAQAGQYVFRGNSCYDPDYTGTGHQPRYFDQYSAVYSKYLVHASSITVEFMNNISNSPVFCVVIPASDIPTLLSGAPASEYPRAVTSKLLGVSGIETAKVSCQMRTDTILGLRPQQINDLDFSALTGATPSQVWYWNLFFQNVNPYNLGVSVTVKLTYEVEFYDRLEISPS